MSLGEWNHTENSIMRETRHSALFGELDGSITRDRNRTHVKTDDTETFQASAENCFTSQQLVLQATSIELFAVPAQLFILCICHSLFIDYFSSSKLFVPGCAGDNSPG